MKIGSLRGKLEGMEEAPMPMEGGESPESEMADMQEDAAEVGTEPVDLASVSDDELMAEMKKRGLA